MVGWLLAEDESAALAEHLLAETCVKQGVKREQLTVDAGNGAAMSAKKVAVILTFMSASL